MAESTTVSTMQRPEWNIQLLEDFYYEASQPQPKLLGIKGRKAVWKSCLWFGCEKRGVPGVACQLFERYLFSILHDENHDISEEEFRLYLKPKLPLLVASCITLASKMNNSASPVDAKLVHTIFMCKKISFTMEEIIKWEAKVYSKLGFRIPLRTNVEIGEMLAAEVGIPSPMMDTIAMLVDVADYKRYTINNKVRDHHFILLPSLAVADVLTLHLIAGAVAAIAPIRYNQPDLVPRLSQLTKAPIAYIKCIRDVICTIVLSEEPQHVEGSLKRK